MQLPADILLYSILLLTLFIVIGVGLWRGGRIGKAIALVLLAGVCVIAFEIYIEVYPSDSFYVSEFTHVTGYEFPASGRILFKESSYPDIHGDYESCAVIEVSKEDYEVLRSKVGSSNSDKAEDECMYHLWDTLKTTEVAAESSNCNQKKTECKYWALMAGGHNIVIHYDSW